MHLFILDALPELMTELSTHAFCHIVMIYEHIINQTFLLRIIKLIQSLSLFLTCLIFCLSVLPIVGILKNQQLLLKGKICFYKEYR